MDENLLLSLIENNAKMEVVDEGVTSFLATTLTQSEEVLTNAVSNVAKVVEEGYEGAEILGIHFEGPYLNKAHKGAQPEEYCVKPDVEQFKRYQKAAHGLIMGLSFRKRIKLGNGTYLNLSKSGASISKKVGRTTINSRGNVTVNLGNGMSYRTSVKKKKK